MGFPVLTAAANVLAHAPGLVRYGSKPLRDLAQDPARLEPRGARLRPCDDAVGYGPNQAYIGNLEPEALREVPRPWFGAPDRGAPSEGAFGDLIGEAELLGLMKRCDRARLVQLDEGILAAARKGLIGRGRGPGAGREALAPAPADAVAQAIRSGEAIPLWHEGRIAGSMPRGHEADEALTANVLLENLAAKATGALALRALLRSLA